MFHPTAKRSSIFPSLPARTSRLAVRGTGSLDVVLRSMSLYVFPTIFNVSHSQCHSLDHPRYIIIDGCCCRRYTMLFQIFHSPILHCDQFSVELWWLPLFLLLNISFPNSISFLSTNSLSPTAVHFPLSNMNPLSYMIPHASSPLDPS